MISLSISFLPDHTCSWHYTGTAACTWQDLAEPTEFGVQTLHRLRVPLECLQEAVVQQLVGNSQHVYSGMMTAAGRLCPTVEHLLIRRLSITGLDTTQDVGSATLVPVMGE